MMAFLFICNFLYDFYIDTSYQYIHLYNIVYKLNHETNKKYVIFYFYPVQFLAVLSSKLMVIRIRKQRSSWRRLLQQSASTQSANVLTSRDLWCIVSSFIYDVLSQTAKLLLLMIDMLLSIYSALSSTYTDLPHINIKSR